MAHYKTLLKHIGGWIHHQATLYGHTSIPCTGQCHRAAVNFITSVQIEVGRYTRIPLEERICQLCHQGVEFEEYYAWFFMK